MMQHTMLQGAVAQLLSRSSTAIAAAAAATTTAAAGSSSSSARVASAAAQQQQQQQQQQRAHMHASAAARGDNSGNDGANEVSASTSNSTTSSSSTSSSSGRRRAHSRATSPSNLHAIGPDGAAELVSPKAGDWAAAAARAPALSLLRRYFAVDVPRLRGQAVLARVVRSAGGGSSSGSGSGGGGAVLLDPGYYGLTPVARHALGASPEYRPDGRPVEARPPPARTAAAAAAGAGAGAFDDGALAAATVDDAADAARQPLRRGAHVRVRLGQLFTPFGDVELRPVRARRDVPPKLVWDELRACMQRGAPVRGRVLNACAGGYAVGVAGFVALLPSRQASIHNIQSIGTLQRFYVHRMDWRRRRVELSNYAAAGGAGGGAGGASADLWSNL